MEVKDKKAISPNKANERYQKMLARKMKMRQHFQQGGTLSELSKEEFSLVKPL
ncbi:hypothetical protein [Tunicatimonas pelagia]|uniref:hypothetical protein n=1 Tax=Tunicatimonas pelagia TaxID=931531 RepID=UPI0026655E88|nr:hypothetical protein [Tunicatimonas pelagia]WKN41562.1 hypothetical protein P0M28_21235 [Tunicatimonas pelagia]